MRLEGFSGKQRVELKNSKTILQIRRGCHNNLKLLRELVIVKIGQARKSARRMPWHQEPKKDAISCDKLRGGANNLRSADLRMRELTWEKPMYP